MHADTLELIDKIKELRESDSRGIPKNTQEEVADELGISQTYVSILENQYLEPDSTPKETPEATKNKPEMSEETNDNESENVEVEQIDEENIEEKPKKFICGECGSNDFYEPDEYISHYGSRLNKGQIAVAQNANHICATCGEVC